MRLFQLMYRVFILIIVLASCKQATQEVNVYSGRHYRSDELLFQKFTEQTGIRVNLIKADSDQLINRILLEGENTRADLYITADVGRLARAVSQGILQTIPDPSMLSLVPENLREPKGRWIGLTKRARVIAYHLDRVQPNELSTYEALADDKWRGRILVRSSQSHYNQTLMASILAANGTEEATAWSEAVVNNMAQPPRGNDRDQVKAMAAGVGDLALINTYYLGLLLRSSNSEERQVAAELGLFFPNQQGRGAHVNLSGMGITRYAKNKENALELIRFLLSNESQTFLANENFEYPVLAEADWPDLLQQWGEFKSDTVNVARLGELIPEAMLVFNKTGWQ